MSEVVKTLEPIFQKIADFFNLFDLSFIISGVITSSAIAFFLHSTGQINFNDIHIHGFLFFAAIAVIYAVGLVSWVIGRYFRTVFPRYIHVHHKFVEHKATNDLLYKRYVSDDIKDVSLLEKKMKTLYGYLWVLVRENLADKESYSLLKRYWVQTATFDGLVTSFCLWGLVFFSILFISPIHNLTLSEQGHSINKLIGCIGLGLAIISMLVVLSEAIRYKKYQMGELVDTYIKTQRDK